MPGKVVATYLARITLREPTQDEPADPAAIVIRPTIEVLEEAVESALRDRFEWLEPNVSAERVDA